MRNILRKSFFLKGKKSFTNNNTQGSNIGNPKENKMTKKKFNTTKLTKLVRVGLTFMGFQWPSKKGFDQQSLRQQTNNFQIKQTNKNINQN